MDVQERISSVVLARPYIPLADSPDGEISAADRAHMAHAYTGILAVHPLPSLTPRWAMAIARRTVIQIVQHAAVRIEPQPVILATI